MMLESKKLLIFKTVAEQKSFTKAAALLRVAQPALSYQLSQLETELGFALFERSKRKAPILTPEGRLFLKESTHVVQQLTALESFAQNQLKRNTTMLSISYTPSLADYQLASVLRKFRQDHPNSTLISYERGSEKQIESIQAGDVDIGIIRRGGQLPKGLKRLHLRDQTIRIAVPSAHPLAAKNKTKIEWADLENERTILISPAIASREFYTEFYKKLNSHGVRIKRVETAVGIANQIWMVASGEGIAPIPVFDVPTVAGVKWLEFSQSHLRHRIDIVWRPANESKAVKDFIQLMTDSYQLE